MAEDSDYNPGAWSGHNFNSAKSYYDSSAGRSYAAEATKKAVVSGTLIPKSIRTESTSPLIVMTDVTGSMGEWPQTIFSKLPYLDIEGKTYLGPDMEISFAANTDLLDSYPLHIRPFKSGTELTSELGAFQLGGGAGPIYGHEAYELGAAYYAFNVEMPNAVRPVFIFIADESPHPTLTMATAAQYNINLPKDMTVDEVFAALKAKASVYLVHKAYSDGGASRRTWARLLGEDHIADLEDPSRVVDVIFGILAQETGQVAYFHTEIEGRQDAGQVRTTYKALGTIHAAITPPAIGGKSTMHKPTGGTATKSLL